MCFSATASFTAGAVLRGMGMPAILGNTQVVAFNTLIPKRTKLTGIGQPHKVQAKALKRQTNPVPVTVAVTPAK